MNEFEQKISRQPIKAIPGEWRAEILAVTDVSWRTKSDRKLTFAATLKLRLREIFWPAPVAWVGLAAIWIFILAVDFSMRDKSGMVAEKVAPPSPDVIAELRQQRLLFAQLMGSTETHDADRQKSFLPRPRTERSFEMLTA
jgi:hypothetical protein